MDTDIQKQCTLINVKVFNNQCTPVDFYCTLILHKLIIHGNSFSVDTMFFSASSVFIPE